MGREQREPNARPANERASSRRVSALLSPAERRAARELTDRVRRRVHADLVEAALFGSKARREARPDSDIDILLVFRQLPPDREPQAGHAERIAEEVAGETGIPVTVWSVSLVDLREGQRTPMLVDALADAVPLWFASVPLPAVPFTPADALRCAGALLQRVREGSREFGFHMARGDHGAAARRLRGDVVRLSTGSVLLTGETRPRRGDAVRRFAEIEWGAAGPPPGLEPLLAWAASSYGPDGRDEDRPVRPPPGGLRAGARWVPVLERRVRRRGSRLASARLAREPGPDRAV